MKKKDREGQWASEDKWFFAMNHGCWEKERRRRRRNTVPMIQIQKRRDRRLLQLFFVGDVSQKRAYNLSLIHAHLLEMTSWAGRGPGAKNPRISTATTDAACELWLSYNRPRAIFFTFP